MLEPDQCCIPMLALPLVILLYRLFTLYSISTYILLNHHKDVNPPPPRSSLPTEPAGTFQERQHPTEDDLLAIGGQGLQGPLKSAVSLYLEASASPKMGKKKSKSKNKTKLAAAATGQTATTSPSSIDNITAPLPLFDAESSQRKGCSSAEIEHNNNFVIRPNQLQKEKQDREPLAKKRGTEPTFSGEGSSESACTRRLEKHVNSVSNRFCFLDVSFENGVVVNTTSGCEHGFCYRADTKERASFREIQVINYYDLRLSIEKSERKKDALRKQREVELEQANNLDEEEYAAEVRKSMMQMKSEHTASAKMEAEEIKAGYERAAVSRELTKQLDKRLRADAASSFSSPFTNPVEGPPCQDNDGSQFETSSSISESPLAAKKDPKVLVDTCHGFGAGMTHSQLERPLNYDPSQCSECGGVQDEGRSNLSEMMVRGWKVAAVEIPPRALKEGGETKEREKAEEGGESNEAKKTKEGEKAQEDEEATEGEEAEEDAEANRGQKLLDARKQKMSALWRIDVDNCIAPSWPRTDSNATDHNAPFAFAKNTPEDNKGEPDPTFSAEQLDTLHRNNFVKPLKAFVVKMAAAQKLNQQINPDWEFAEPLLRVARREEELAYDVFLSPRVVAEARGWRDIVEDIDDVVQTALED